LKQLIALSQQTRHAGLDPASSGLKQTGLMKNANCAFALLALINLDKWGLPLAGQVRPA